MTDYERRRQFVRQYGWSVPTKEAVEQLKDFIGDDQVIEIGAGIGLWAKLLQDEGVPVVATDNFELATDPKADYITRDPPFTTIEDLDHEESLQSYPEHGVLMFIWPPCDDPMATSALKAFRGNKVIYIGEFRGCTANDEFHDILDSNWTETNRIYIPHWHGISDSVMLLVRK